MSAKPTSDDPKYRLLIEEYKEAWAHYRHLETKRSTYLGFFFTFALGVFGFTFTMLERDSDNHWVWFASGILLWILEVLTVFIFMAVKKIAPTLEFYYSMIISIRQRIYDSEFENYDRYLNVYKSFETPDKMKYLRLFKEQRSAELILQFFGFAISSIQMIAIQVLWRKGQLILIELIILYPLVLGLLSIQLLVSYLALEPGIGKRIAATRFLSKVIKVKRRVAALFRK